MFLLHERTRKLICRWCFVALCVVPTCAVALWAASRNGEGHRARCEAELSRLLQLKVALGGVEYPEPGAVRYTDFLLADPQTEEPIARATTIEVRTTDSVVAITTSQLTIESDAAYAIAELLHNRLRDRTVSGGAPFHLGIAELIVASPDGDIQLFNVRARLEPTSEGRGAQLTFRTTDMDKNVEPVVLTIVRGHNGRSGFEFNTQDRFNELAGRFGHVLQLLRTLVTDNEVMAPVTHEAQALMRIPPITPR